MTALELYNLCSKFSLKPIIFENQGDCIICTSHYDSHGYTRITHRGKEYPLHRLIYTEIHGEIAQDLVVRHKCDNRRCCNPDHLESGSHRDNILDAITRGSMNLGINNGMCKLSASDINYIRASKERSRVLEERFKISRKTVYNIRNNRTH